MGEYETSNNICMCCICYGKETYYSMIHCNMCVEGKICNECYQIYNNGCFDKTYCPICKNYLVSEAIRIMVFNCMHYYANDYCCSKYHYKLLSPLIKRFVKNYMETEFFKYL